MTIALQRSHGRAEICRRDGRLARLFQQGCARILLPRGPGRPEAVIVNTAGGITGGDRLEYSAQAGPDEHLCVTTQAAERVYRSAAGEGRQVTRLKIEAGARLDWLPQETILYEGAALTRELHVEMAADATFLALETLIYGRQAMGERPAALHLRDHWRIRRDGRLIHAEALRLDAMPETRAGLAGAGASATLIHIAPGATDRLEHARAILPGCGCECAASAWNGVLAVRFLARSGQEMRRTVTLFLRRFGQVGLPRVWQF